MTTKSPYEPTTREEREAAKGVRPKDAATMILIRKDDDKPRILMGQRSRGHDFMPDKFVFPGGRVDTQDGRAPALSELNETCETALQKKNTEGARARSLLPLFARRLKKPV